MSHTVALAPVVAVNTTNVAVDTTVACFVAVVDRDYEDYK